MKKRWCKQINMMAHCSHLGCRETVAGDASKPREVTSGWRCTTCGAPMTGEKCRGACAVKKQREVKCWVGFDRSAEPKSQMTGIEWSIDEREERNLRRLTEAAITKRRSGREALRLNGDGTFGGPKAPDVPDVRVGDVWMGGPDRTRRREILSLSSERARAWVRQETGDHEYDIDFIQKRWTLASRREEAPAPDASVVMVGDVWERPGHRFVVDRADGDDARGICSCNDTKLIILVSILRRDYTLVSRAAPRAPKAECPVCSNVSPPVKCSGCGRRDEGFIADQVQKVSPPRGVDTTRESSDSTRPVSAPAAEKSPAACDAVAGERPAEGDLVERDLVERVARAMYARPGLTELPWEKALQGTGDLYLVEARAAMIARWKTWGGIKEGG